MESAGHQPKLRRGPLFEPTHGRDAKDPCPVFDGRQWHLYGSVGSVVVERWRILHAIAPNPTGPWTEQPPATLTGVCSDRIAAPGVVFDNEQFHMFVQTDFLSTGGSLEYLVSTDGQTFERVCAAITANPEPSAGEAGLFDAHPAVIHGELCLLYAAMGEDLSRLRWQPEQYHDSIRGPDIYLARSTSKTWAGPWERLGPILRQEDVPMHSQIGDPDYEWGLEGPQAVELPSRQVLLQAVCFVPGHRRGTRQRLFFAVADNVCGPYRIVGQPINPIDEDWQSGEVGHGTLLLSQDTAWLYYQARSALVGARDNGEARWRYGVACWPVEELVRYVG